MQYHLRNLTTPSDPLWQEALTLIDEYKTFLQEDICFQKPDTGLEQVQKQYGAPQGALVLALSTSGEVAGMVALQALPAKGEAEMKRLFVRPAHSGHGLGRMLIEAIEEQALLLGYHTIRLDTLPKLKSALHLYDSLGYTSCDAYYHNPLCGVIYLEKELG